MPEGKQRFSIGDGPPGTGLGGPIQGAQHSAIQMPDCLITINRLYEKHKYTQKSIMINGGMLAPSARTSFFKSHQLICGKGMLEHSNRGLSFHTSRTRLPANNHNQMRGLRHGCQRSLTIHNPIMEE